jgi:hypothetical protein
MPVTSTTTPPGAALYAPVFFAVSLLFVLSLLEHNPSEKVTIRTKQCSL